MRKFAFLALSAVCLVAGSVQANLLTNGSLDSVGLNPPLVLNSPNGWTSEGLRTVSGPFDDFLSSEPWAGPAPTPVTTGGAAGEDFGVFFKPFTGTTANGATTGHLYQDVAGTPGQSYTFSGWAGGEVNFMGRAEFAVEFIDVNGLVISGSTLDLVPAGLLTDNGLTFDYKQYSVSGVAPAGTIGVRGRVSMLDAMDNPGAGQAFVVDDFSLVVPEPASLATLAVGGLLFRRRRA